MIFKNILRVVMLLSVISLQGLYAGGLREEDAPKSLCVIMAGNPTYIESKELGGELTYARIYKPSDESDDFRKRLEGNVVGGDKVRKHTTEVIEDYRSSHSCSECIGHSFLDDIQEGTAYNCAEYAFNGCNSPLLSKIKRCMDKNQNLGQRDQQLKFLRLCFTCVNDSPQDGDLVVYYRKIPKNEEELKTGKCEEELQHFGIYRTNGPNPNQEAVESQWGLNYTNPGVYKLPIFFNYDYYGEIARFYRLKKKLL